MNHGDLADGIERLVREYISTIRIAAQGAVERAVAPSNGGRSAPTASAKPRPARATPSRHGAHRPSEEVGELRERLYEAVCQMPGETMLVLAPKVGATAGELYWPRLVLLREGRIRSVGTRHLTRYFPMVARDAQRSSV